ncbi:MAG: hypothetical protein GXY11_01930 [Clostridiales bacterium]|nr:hypothetical protein [Clostridiales bacterium]
MKKRAAALTACVLLCFLSAGCVEGEKGGGPTINDMTMPAVSDAASPAGGSVDVDVPAGKTVAGGTAGTGTEGKTGGDAIDALCSCEVPESYRIDISMKLEEKFKKGPNAFIVPFELKGRIRAISGPPAKMDIRVNSRARFASEDIDYAAEVYMEKTGDGYTSYSNETGEWVRTVRSGGGALAVTLKKEDWDALALSARGAKPAGYEDVGGVTAKKTEASVRAREVYALFGEQLSCVIPGMQTASPDDKASGESMRMFVYTSESGEVLQLRFDAGAAWGKLVGDSFATRSTDEFDVSVQNVEIRLTVSEFNAVESFDVPQKALNAIKTAGPSPSDGEGKGASPSGL